MASLDPWYLQNLVCPVDRSDLRLDGAFIVSSAGRRYPIVDGIPVMLRDDVEQTIGVARRSLDLAFAIANGEAPSDAPLYADTLGVTEEERLAARRLHASGARYDPVVATMIGATSGVAYKHLIGADIPYPIPAFRFSCLKPGRMIDIGCNWGRWTISAAREGHDAVGLDPQLGAVMAGRRVAAQLGAKARFVVGDARFLPFRNKRFDYAWSYSVLQHFSREDVKGSLMEVRRVLRPGGTARIQMANAFGARSLYHLARRRFRAPANFDVRYWSPFELKTTFAEVVGPTSLSADCFFGLGLQWSDLDQMTGLGKPAVIASEGMRRASNHVPPLRLFADSIFCTSEIPAGAE